MPKQLNRYSGSCSLGIRDPRMMYCLVFGKHPAKQAMHNSTYHFLDQKAVY